MGCLDEMGIICRTCGYRAEIGAEDYKEVVREKGYIQCPKCLSVNNWEIEKLLLSIQDLEAIRAVICEELAKKEAQKMSEELAKAVKKRVKELWRGLPMSAIASELCDEHMRDCYNRAIDELTEDYEPPFGFAGEMGTETLTWKDGQMRRE